IADHLDEVRGVALPATQLARRSWLEDDAFQQELAGGEGGSGPGEDVIAQVTGARPRDQRYRRVVARGERDVLDVVALPRAIVEAAVDATSLAILRKLGVRTFIERERLRAGVDVWIRHPHRTGNVIVAHAVAFAFRDRKPASTADCRS